LTDDEILTSPTKTITSTMEGMLLPEDFGVSLLKQRKSKAEQQSKIWLIYQYYFWKGTEAQTM
jgi:anthranilate phosphoribosyltransferase